MASGAEETEKRIMVQWNTGYTNTRYGGKKG